MSLPVILWYSLHGSYICHVSFVQQVGRPVCFLGFASGLLLEYRGVAPQWVLGNCFAPWVVGVGFRPIENQWVLLVFLPEQVETK